MTDKVDVLSKIGLSKNEAIIYTALLKIGSASATDITKETRIHRSNVYDSLNNLIKKGCVSYIQKDKTKYFEATNPENLKNVIKEKEIKLASIIPQLSRDISTGKRMSVNFYTGYKGVKDTINNIMESGKEYLSYGVPMRFPQKLKSWLDRHHRERFEKHIPIKIIFNAGAKDRAKIVNKNVQLAEAKYFPEGFDAPVTTEIHGDNTIIILWDEEPLTIHIDCKEIADAYRRYFSLLWNIAKKPE